jgi:hypothetical protein
MYILLGKNRSRVREIARSHYLANPLDPQSAIKAATEEIKTKSIIATILISLAVRLAVELIMYWFKNNILLPSTTYVDGEPGK